MNLTIENPRDIYNIINSELLKIVASLSSETSDGELNKAQGDARDKIAKMQGSLKSKLDELETNSEWSTFTIAFYGETGAGKSTLIETLRILLSESSKSKRREKFKTSKLSYEQSVAALPNIEAELVSLDRDFDQLQQQLSSLTHDFDNEQSKLVKDFETSKDEFNIEQQHFEKEYQAREQELLVLKNEIANLQQLILEKKASASLWQKIVLLFKKLPEEQTFIQELKKLPRIEELLATSKQKLALHQESFIAVSKLHDEKSAKLISQFEASSESLERAKRLAEQTRLAVKQQLESVTKEINDNLLELERYADGEIIGDGRADFTRKTQRYSFNIGLQHFNLLDVPGIEGKEGLVLEEIEKAVQAAHAVFYVTNKAAPPQTGENERKGTLEKIKQHLGAQTEVWSVFNKKITNPKYTLKNKVLLSGDEQASLAEMDEKVREQLKENYQGSFSLTALPAFVASADCLLPNSQMSKRRDKFLEDFSEQELLEQSRLSAFIEMLKSNLLLDSQNKITKANFNKVKEVLDGSTNRLDEIEKKYTVAADGIQANSESARHQLQTSYGILKSQLQGKGQEQIRKEIQKVRKRLYEKIDRDISNDEFKEALEKFTKECVEEIQNQLPYVMEEVVQSFETAIEDIFKRFSELSQDLLATLGTLGSTKLGADIKINIDLDSGINKSALVGALIAAAMAPFTAGASLWITGAAILSGVIAFTKGVWSFFSTDFKMSEQRKSLDTNLNSIENELKKALQKSIDNAKTEMNSSINELDRELRIPVEQMIKTSALLERSNKSLKLLSREIENIEYRGAFHEEHA
ncbi:hypothetical protein [Pseudoalteromonas piscicida]|uniref:DUF726 domain-containing protein n=1 Tax=Pseudoalteromonas piscicida TaxID=43662 RepID=A0AAD0RFH5_PSEO7|nr:hypothetical protein [Pseudoalteromonas piscicida]ASD67585.1 hypothetical protein B1L02_11545 [Pseudoalteromonas piscicida]AXR01712.1 DUF726 domain-containing protein [Pseudoalteromonas piscicida]